MIKEMMDIGFTDKEARIYSLLAERGELSAPSIASELNIERRTVYDVLNSLFKKGWVSKKHVQNTEIYSIIDASLIAKEAYDKYLNFKKIVPDLKRKESDKLEVNILFGIKAIQHLVTSALREKSELFLMGRGGYLIDQMGESKYQYIPKLNQLNWKMIQTEEYKNEEFRPKEIRYLPKGTVFETAFLTFSNKVYLFSKQKEIVLIEIVDPSFAETFRKYFQFFWNISKQVKQS